MVDQRRLVTDIGCGAIRSHFAAIGGLAAVTTGNHAYFESLLSEMGHQRHHHRGFARAASEHIAHHNHGHLHALGLEPAHPVQLASQSPQAAK